MQALFNFFFGPFVVAGGGFAGVETIASINDFLHDALPFYPNLKNEMLRVVLAATSPREVAA